ncbi:chitin synthase chs-1 [Octopus bimaculoides]|uniref:chitin synthase n=1 Tax=Octopus bimaculoides TaxID=37653 RepID=A0A0L8I011_OCTBM|nr:chitin synthase chs-1 [Octopus bimaculoides]XP_014768207.1 chitin synthase chs-1 [Octopus bimaculoides]XP_014768208.1 chitin synthase chs-1 [Octopus bimaculoides]XP_014768209.1 chitin synthase chs-1 [Octopus bimaculoides]|eukprot:XP_014768206.1 PREDICTED: uncharacterized protein LOC106867755 [Octopus bimaculoides]
MAVKLGKVVYRNHAFVNDNFSLHEPQHSERHVHRKLPWDVFTETSHSNFRHGNVIQMTVLKILFKLLCACVLTILIFSLAVTNRITLIILTQSLRINEDPRHCNNGSQLMHFCEAISNCTTKTSSQNSRREINVSSIWAMLLVICCPYIYEFIVNMWRVIFKRLFKLEIKWFILICVTECLHTVGLWMLVFVLLPNVEPVQAVLILYGITFFPCLLDFVASVLLFETPSSYTVDYSKKKSFGRIFLTVLIFLLTAMLIASYTYFQYKCKPTLHYLIPIALILVSIRWWESFADIIEDEFFTEMLSKIKENKAGSNVFMSPLKIALNLFLTALYFSFNKECTEVLIFVNEKLSHCGLSETTLKSDPHFNEPFTFASINIISSFLCFQFAKVACKLMLQNLSFSFPLIIVGPASFFLVSYIQHRRTSFLDFGQVNCNDFVDVFQQFGCNSILLILLFIAYVITTRHVWYPKIERLAKDRKLFFKLSYCGILLDQDLLLNRRHDKGEVKADQNAIRISAMKYDADGMHMYKLGSTPKIYACATMWHETENEMLQLLKSMFRMDKDQFTRSFMQEKVGIVDNDYYEFEGHIFFDDAYTRIDGEPQINAYVECLMKLVEKAGSAIHTDVFIEKPTICSTPYGDRLEWILPGGNKLVAHLKDKNKIRHRKRWSQVMYMYYVLGHQIASVDIKIGQKVKRSDNTFLLALDGDVDFEPSSVLLLLDRMKRNPVVGAACGRIHPIGNGPMVWYQKFEYAVSHWLQKSAEHMTGCVLCSPGCFSLFRGSALIKPNVLKRYTTMPTEAKHHVQYDQGEDRWLCTLLLQEGSRVEYCAASDALTYCPENFNEFFKQRRRWAPSTMANIIELLVDWRHVRQVNSSISLPYIIYQTGLMAVSIITPATIFLLVVGALTAAFPSISLTASLFINLIPVVIMLFLCFVSPEDTQLKFASIITLFYTIAMMLVFVGLMKEIFEYKFCSTTAFLFTFVAGTFLTSAFAHPQEFSCVLHGLLYFLFVPSTSILLMVYALGNLHNITWGTRDNAAKGKPAPVKGKKMAFNQIKNVLMSNSSEGNEKESEYSFSCGYLCRCLCFLKEKSNKELTLLATILEKLDNLIKPKASKKIDSEQTVPLIKINNDANAEKEGESRAEDQDLAKQQPIQQQPIQHQPIQHQPVQQQPQPEEQQPTVETQESNRVTFADSSGKPTYWQEHEYLKTLNVAELSEREDEFWRELIQKYLFPIEEDAKKKKEMEAKLLELRNNVCLAFFIINALFVVVIYAIEYNVQTSKSIGLQIYCSDMEKTKIVNVISLVFSAVFGVTLVIQLIAMLFHRCGTFLHILSTIDLSLKPINKEIIEECRQSLLSTSKGDNYSDATTDTVGSTNYEKKKNRRETKKIYKSKAPPLYKDLPSKAENTLVHVVDDYVNQNDTTHLFSINKPKMNWMPLLDNEDIQKEVFEKTDEIKQRWRTLIDRATTCDLTTVKGVTKALMEMRNQSNTKSNKDEQEDSICITGSKNDVSSSPKLRNKLPSIQFENYNSTFETDAIVHSSNKVKIPGKDTSSSDEDFEVRSKGKNKLLRYTSDRNLRRNTNLKSKQNPLKRAASLLISSKNRTPTTKSVPNALTSTTTLTTAMGSMLTVTSAAANAEYENNVGAKMASPGDNVNAVPQKTWNDDSISMMTNSTDEETLSDNSDRYETQF